jgi:predicted Na+-dependent transporter
MGETVLRMVLIMFIVLGLPFTVVNAMIAYQKGRSVLWAIIVSVLLTPFTSYLYLLAVPALAKKAPEPQARASVWKDC